MEREYVGGEEAVIDLGAVTSETKGAVFGQLDTLGTLEIPMGLSDD